MANEVRKITLTQLGSDAGPNFSVQYSADCNTYTQSADCTNIFLPSVGSFAYCTVDDSAVCIKLISKGSCTNEVVENPSVTSTTTASPTTTTTLSPTTTTTLGPTTSTTLAPTTTTTLGPTTSTTLAPTTSTTLSPTTTTIAPTTSTTTVYQPTIYTHGAVRGTCSDYCTTNYNITTLTNADNDYNSLTIGDTIYGQGGVAGYVAYSNVSTDTSTGPFRIAQIDSSGVVLDISICVGSSCEPL